MPSSLDSPIDVRHYLRVLWRRKGIVVLSTVTVLCAAFVALTFIPERYQSQVTLMIEDRRPLARDLEQLMGGMPAPSQRYGADQERLSKLTARVRSRPFLEQVIRTLKMQEDPVVRAEAESRHKEHPNISTEEIAVRLLVQRLQSRIQFRAVSPGIYQIILADFSPQNAQILAKWVSELFKDISIQKELEQIRSARDFGAEQLRIYEQQLRRSEEALERYKGLLIQQDLASAMVRPGNLTQAEALSQRLQDDVATTQARLRELERDAARARIDVQASALGEDPETLELVRQVGAALRSAINDRLSVSTPSEAMAWPPQGAYALLRRDLFQRLESHSAVLQPEAGADAVAVAARYAFSKLDGEIQSAARTQLDQAIQSFREKAQAQPVDDVQVARLEGEVAKNNQLLESFRAQMVAGDVSQAVETTKLGLRMEILDPAQLPLAPSSPNRKKILLAACLMGPLLGAGLAFLSETMDVRLRSLDDFRRMVPEPILCTTPLLTTLVPRPHAGRRYWVPASLVLVGILTIGLFVARKTLLQSFGTESRPVEIVNPQNAVQP
jgi:uncharacterized protein involved in exopolysaccharide biosynthesis